MARVIGVARARDNQYIWPQRAHMFDDVVDQMMRVDGDDDSGGIGEAANLKELLVGGVAVLAVVAVAAVAGHPRGVGIGGDVGNAVLFQQRAYHFADPAVADDDGVSLPPGRPHHQL